MRVTKAKKYEPRRRSLETEADTVFANVKARLLGLETPVDPSELVVVAKGKALFLFDLDSAEMALRAWDVPTLFTEIQADRSTRSDLDVPVVIILGNEACVAWLGCAVIAPGAVS